MSTKKSVVLSLSGGLDSTVLLYHLLKEGYDVRCLSVDYGQRHRKELQSASIIVKTAQRDVRFTDRKIEHRVADLSGMKFLFAGSSQTSEEIPVPEGHYAEESMKQTVVPNRNMVFLSLATAWAVATKSEGVAYAAHSGDHAIYPDCRPEFTEAMEDAMRLCDWHSVKLLRPFLYPSPMSKTDVVRLGADIGVPFSLTWSCYKGGDTHCGRCSTCVERREAFTCSDVKDPTVYEDETFYPSMRDKGLVK